MQLRCLWHMAGQQLISYLHDDDDDDDGGGGGEEERITLTT